MLQLKKNEQLGRLLLQRWEVLPQGRLIPMENSDGKADGLLDPIKGLGVAVMGMSEKINHGSIEKCRYLYAPITLG